MSDIAIHVEGLGKRYRIGARQQRVTSLRAALGRALASPLDCLARTLRPPSDDEIVWALKDVSFDVRHGEVIGVIGRNGAGKSTLLKILSRITEPTTGFADINGRVGSLLEVGTGFHPELTGRENIYLNGAILGMSRAEIDRKFDEIVAFSGVEKFIDTPVKRYSSGMYVRLAFAVAAHLEPEILLVDEVLAVGDVAFQQKCLGKMGDVAREGRTVLFVSHNMVAVEQLCQRVIWLDEGRIRAMSDKNNAIRAYLASMVGGQQPAHWARRTPEEGPVSILAVTLKSPGQAGPESGLFDFDKPIRVETVFKVAEPVRNYRVMIGVISERSIDVLESWSSDAAKSNGAGNNALPEVLNKGVYRATCTLPACLLLPGSYRLRVRVFRPQRQGTLDQVDALGFTITDTGYYDVFTDRYGVVAPRLAWEIGPVKREALTEAS